MAERVVLDACVLYPPLVRTLLLAAARAGLIEPRWSSRILEEWRIAAARAGDEAGALAATEAMRRDWPGALIEAPTPLDLALPDPADVHVLQAAVAADASLIVTFNLRDFPGRMLARYGVVARHPDGLLWKGLGEAPQALGAAIEAAAGSDRQAARKLLKRSDLPRLGKAWAAG